MQAAASTLRHPFGRLILLAAMLVLLLNAGCGGGGSGPRSDAGEDPAQPAVYARFAYALHAGDATLSAYFVDADSGQLRHNGYAQTGNTPVAMAIHPSSRFAYTVNLFSRDVSAFALSTRDGALTSLGSVSTNGTGPLSVAIAPAGRHLYVVNRDSGTVAMFEINLATGALTPLATPVPAGATPIAITLDQAGRFAYVLNAGGPSITVFRVDPDAGTLEPTGLSAPTTASSLTFSPSGRFAYVVNAVGHSISGWAVNESTGALTVTMPPMLTGGQGPNSVALEPGGRFAYVANGTSGTISVFAVDAGTGALSPLGAPVDAGPGCNSLAVDPTGRFVHVANGTDNTLMSFAIDPATGLLSRVHTVSARQAPAAIALAMGSTPVRLQPGSAYLAQPTAGITTHAVDPQTGRITRVGAAVDALGTTVLTLDPRGQTLFSLTRQVAGSVSSGSAYRIGSNTGELTPAGAAVSFGVFDFRAWQVEASARFLYAVGLGPSRFVLNGYRIDPGTRALGGLVATFDLLSPAGGDLYPTAVVVDPTGRYLYVGSDQSGGGIRSYTINRSTGALSLNGSDVFLGTSVSSLAMHPSGRFLHAADRTRRQIHTFEINLTNGRIAERGTPAVSGGIPRLATAPSGRFLYAANVLDDTLSVFRVDPDSGALTTVGSPIRTGDQDGTFNPLVLDPSGQFAYLQTAGGVTAYAMDQVTGLVSVVGPVADPATSVVLTAAWQ